MKQIITAVFALFIISSCCKKELLNTYKKKILGTWVGVDYPELDSAIFMSNDEAILTGRLGNGENLNFTIEEDRITLKAISNDLYYPYTFKDDSLFLHGILPSNWDFDGTVILIKK